MLNLTCNHLEMNELKKCKQKQRQFGWEWMTSALIGGYKKTNL